MRQWWDLPPLRARYDEFLARYQPVLTGYRRRRAVDPRAAFADYVRVLTDWRRLPYADPGLPLAILPRGWSGVRAAEVFLDLRDRLASPARTFVDTIR